MLFAQSRSWIQKKTVLAFNVAKNLFLVLSAGLYEKWVKLNHTSKPYTFCHEHKRESLQN